MTFFSVHYLGTVTKIQISDVKRPVLAKEGGESASEIYHSFASVFAPSVLSGLGGDLQVMKMSSEVVSSRYFIVWVSLAPTPKERGRFFVVSHSLSVY